MLLNLQLSNVSVFGPKIYTLDFLILYVKHVFLIYMIFIYYELCEYLKLLS